MTTLENPVDRPEDTAVNELLADIESKTNGNGLGVMRQIWNMNGLMTAGFSVIGARCSCGTSWRG